MKTHRFICLNCHYVTEKSVETWLRKNSDNTIIEVDKEIVICPDCGNIMVKFVDRGLCEKEYDLFMRLLDYGIIANLYLETNVPIEFYNHHVLVEIPGMLLINDDILMTKCLSILHNLQDPKVFNIESQVTLEGHGGNIVIKPNYSRFLTAVNIWDTDENTERIKKINQNNRRVLIDILSALIDELDKG